MRNAAPCSHRDCTAKNEEANLVGAGHLLSLAVLKGTDHAQDHEIQCLLCCPPLTVNLYKMSGTIWREGPVLLFLSCSKKRVSNVISENLHYACPTSITKEDNHQRQSEELNCILHF